MGSSYRQKGFFHSASRISKKRISNHSFLLLYAGTKKKTGLKGVQPDNPVIFLISLPAQAQTAFQLWLQPQPECLPYVQAGQQ